MTKPALASLVLACLAAPAAAGFFVTLSAPEAQAAPPAHKAPAPGVSPAWTKMPLLPAKDKAAGIFPGGEGSQWPRGPVAVSPADPNFLLLPIDVGGLYRTLDGGAHWNVAMVGWDARGANGFAIDPKNAMHVLGIGGNSMDWDTHWGPSPHGLYLSQNKAASWKHVLAVLPGTGGKCAWDPASYSPVQKICTTAYYLAPTLGLLRSSDGGATWASPLGGPDPDGFKNGLDQFHLAVDKNGVVYAGSKGLFRSADGGRSFRRVYSDNIWGVSVGRDSAVYVSGPGKIAVSHDGGAHWTSPAATGLDTQGGKPICDLAVSPADPRHLLCWVQGDNWQWTRWVSLDAGASWTKAALDSAYAVLPPNSRQGYFTWSPTDPNVAYSLGGDWVTKSTDAGRTFRWAANGYNGIMLGGMFDFSAAHPNTVFLGFQDYNGAFTTDGGATWNYRDVSGKGWGGYDYAGLAVDSTLMLCGDADGWTAPRHLRVSRDGGGTWQTVSGPDGKPLDFRGPDTSFADPVHTNICFASDLRSADHGKTWTRMDACDGVFTASPTTHALYGKRGDAVVRSSDGGATWAKVADLGGGFTDLAVDHQTGRVYAASDGKLKAYENGQWTTLGTPADQYGHTRVLTVATDPQVPSVVYVGGPQNIYASAATVCRSTDGGKTWRNLTVTAPLSASSSGGPHEVSCIRVHPKTREAWLNGQCYGMWRIAPPAPGETGVSAALAAAPPAVRPAEAAALPPPVATEPTLSNGGMEAGSAIPDGWSLSWTGSGKLAIARDTAEHHGEAASLRIASVGGPAKGQAAQLLDAAPGMTFTVSGWVKSSGGASVNFAVQPSNAAWTPIGFQQVGYVQNTIGWTHFEKKVTLPKDTSHVAIVLLLDGTGTAWLDDVSIK